MKSIWSPVATSGISLPALLVRPGLDTAGASERCDVVIAQAQPTSIWSPPGRTVTVQAQIEGDWAVAAIRKAIRNANQIEVSGSIAQIPRSNAGTGLRSVRVMPRPARSRPHRRTRPLQHR